MPLAGIEQAALSFLARYGYAALFVLLTLETAMLLRFVPSELILGVAAASLVSSRLSWWLVVLDSAAAMTLGSLALYAAARYGGRAFLLKHPRWFHVTPARLDKLDAIFRKPAGELSVAWSRALPITRTWASVPAGIARMDATRFALYSFAGHVVFSAAVVWSATTPPARAALDAAVGWALERWPLVLGALVIAAVLLGLWKWRRRSA